MICRGERPVRPYGILFVSGIFQIDITAWAKNNSYAILTHDLDFGTILAVSQASAPSVIQIRTQNLLSSDFKTLLINVLPL